MNARTMKTLIPVACDLLKTTPGKLPARLYGMGYRQTCGRCYGSGAHSFNRQDGAMCYGCSWRGEVAADLTPALIERIRKDVEEGALDRYLDKLRLDHQIVAQGRDLDDRLDVITSAHGIHEKLRALPYFELTASYSWRAQGHHELNELKLLPQRWLSQEDRLEAIRRAVAFVDAMEAYMPVVAAHLAKSIESGLMNQRLEASLAARAEIKARKNLYDEQKAQYDLERAQTQADLADLPPKPRLDLSDLHAKIKARCAEKGSRITS